MRTEIHKSGKLNPAFQPLWIHQPAEQGLSNCLVPLLEQCFTTSEHDLRLEDILCLS